MAGSTPDLLDAMADAVARFHQGLPPVHRNRSGRDDARIAEGNAHPPAPPDCRPRTIVRRGERACLAELEAPRSG